MLVLTLCGSLQPGSANDAVLAVVEERLAVRGALTRRIAGLADLPAFRPDIDVPDVVTAWADDLASGDAVVIATPEYAAGPPGVLKNALDWLVGLATLYRKPVAVVCAGSTGGAFTIEALVRTLSYQGALTIATLGVAAVRTKLDPSGELEDEATRRDLDRLVEVLARAANADDATLLGLITPVVTAHGIDPSRFGLAPLNPPTSPLDG